MGSRCLLCMQLTLAWSLLSLGTLNIAEYNPGGSTKHWWSSLGSSRNYMFQVILHALALLLYCWTRLRILKGTQTSWKLTPFHPGSYSRTKCGPISLSLKLQRGVFLLFYYPKVSLDYFWRAGDKQKQSDCEFRKGWIKKVSYLEGVICVLIWKAKEIKYNS